MGTQRTAGQTRARTSGSLLGCCLERKSSGRCNKRDLNDSCIRAQGVMAQRHRDDSGGCCQRSRSRIKDTDVPGREPSGLGQSTFIKGQLPVMPYPSTGQ